MDAQNSGQAPATDDQELANVLAGLNTNGSGPTVADGLQFEETPGPVVADTPYDAPAEPVVSEDVAQEPVAEPEAPVADSLPTPLGAPVAPVSSNPELDAIKKDALAELRPLVDKLNLPADEKFDTLLLIIRSTDDKTLVTEAHNAAKAIEDESKRAAALLDVIKEIDYFANQS